MYDPCMSQLTMEQVRERVLRHISATVDYWHDQRQHNEMERMEGLAFSILSMLDGCAGDLPGFLVVPNPHETDQDFHKERGEDWFPETAGFDGTDIGGWSSRALARGPARNS